MNRVVDFVEDAPAGSRTRGTSMGGLYVAATLQVPLALVGSPVPHGQGRSLNHGRGHI